MKTWRDFVWLFWMGLGVLAVISVFLLGTAWILMVTLGMLAHVTGAEELRIGFITSVVIVYTLEFFAWVLNMSLAYRRDKL